MGKPKHYDPDWIIKDDEFHPNARIAAKHADANALQAAFDSYSRRLKRLMELERPMTEGEAKMFMLLKAEQAELKTKMALAE